MEKGAKLKVQKLDHIGIAVRDKEVAGKFFEEVLGARKLLDEKWEYRGQEFSWTYFDIGGQGKVELVSSTDPDNFVNRFIEKRGEGLHHITLKVEDLLEAVESLQARGITVLDVNTSNPLWKEAYISPKESFGVLIQLAEFTETDWSEETSPE